MSNTLRLEMELDWTGLLVEADSKAFEAMLTKNRKAWLANCCLSPKTYPQKVFNF
ncbi:UNVERIFIED_CONTAM: hypothetical protein GTU68_044151 [Idotea baltica]|nr:hypothetical protein [Idotea baltica]